MKVNFSKNRLFLIFLAIFFMPCQAFPQENVDKLNTALAGYANFSEGELVNIPKALLCAIDVRKIGNEYSYLVGINGAADVLKPFYILTNKQFQMMDSPPIYNIIFEDFTIEYVGTDTYLQNRIQRNTLIFRITTKRAAPK
jgi:hypothetical protein